MGVISRAAQDASIATHGAGYFFAKSVTFTLIYGIFVLLFMQSGIVFLKKKQSNHSQNWMFLITAVTFVLATINEAALILETSVYLESALVQDNTSSPIDNYNTALKLMIKPNIVFESVSIFQVIISDCIIIWRASVLLQRQRLLIILPSFLLLCSAALDTLFLWNLSKYPEVGLNKLGDILSSAIVAISLATNVVTTTIVLIRFRTHKKEMTSALGAHRATQVETVLALLIESGVLFGLLQSVAVLVFYLPPGEPESDTTRMYAYGAISAIYFGISAIYPTAVIVFERT
ncbi:hypothetical protein BDZ94DRAFT_1303182 [Collybia nuda]|uniref:Uncharacterized protein n=1 Tax=Collybia nuda TaxID=64659 RepID=A0A9P6CRC0_9AGAR|nr:hypothetical protein BDZ94DRAFT_1303182 [Collybia nuda]